MSKKPKRAVQPAEPPTEPPAATPEALAAAVLPAGWLIGARIALLAAMALSGYLAWVSLSGSPVAGCGPDSGCQKVLNSRWAYLLGQPVSVVALVVYAAMLAGTFHLTGKGRPVQQMVTWRMMFLGGCLVVGAAVWFTWVQVAVIRTFCPFCLATHACAVAAALLLFKVSNMAGLEVWTDGLRTRLVGAALAGMATLIVAQALHAPPTFERLSISPPPTNQPVIVASAPTNVIASTATNAVSSRPTNVIANTPTNSAAPPGESPKFLTFFNGLFRLDLREVPLIGPPDRPYAIVSLFDYTCHHCREMHPRILGAMQAFPNQFSIVNLPMPLSPNCNRTVTFHHPLHTNGCEYARIGLAAYRVKPEAMVAYDDWIFTPEHPPPLEKAREFAAQLVGAEALQRALSDPWVDQQIQTSVSIYEVAFRAGRGSMPQLIIGTNVYLGTLSTEDLGAALRLQFGLK